MEIVSEIKYVFEDGTDNIADVVEFIGEHAYYCKLCGGSGEYEDEYGPKGCLLCCSRLVAFNDATGTMRTVDWGESVGKDADGNLHKLGA